MRLDLEISLYILKLKSMLASTLNIVAFASAASAEYFLDHVPTFTGQNDEQVKPYQLMASIDHIPDKL